MVETGGILKGRTEANPKKDTAIKHVPRHMLDAINYTGTILGGVKKYPPDIAFIFEVNKMAKKAKPKAKPSAKHSQRS